MWFQKEFFLELRKRGIYLITNEILQNIPEIKKYKVGIAHIFLMHTSASISINENADPSVRLDFESFLNKLIPDNSNYFTHVIEGIDDMPAHLKSSLLGNEITIPISNGKLKLGTWQGIYLCEHRFNAGKRKIVVTLNGELF